MSQTTFHDTKRRQYQITLSVGIIRKIRNVLGVDLLKALDDATVLEKLSDDVEQLVNVVWLCIEDQAKEQGIDDEAFGMSLDGDSLDAATRALLEALVVFFPAARRPIFRKLITKAEAVQAETLKTINEALDGGAIDKAMDQAINDWKQRLGTVGSNSGA